MRITPGCLDTFLNTGGVDVQGFGSLERLEYSVSPSFEHPEPNQKKFMEWSEKICAVRNAQRKAVLEKRGFLHCPLSGAVMKDPVVASDGYSYENEAIQAYMTRCIENHVPISSPMVPGGRCLQWEVGFETKSSAMKFDDKCKKLVHGLDLDEARELLKQVSERPPKSTQKKKKVEEKKKETDDEVKDSDENSDENSNENSVTEDDIVVKDRNVTTKDVEGTTLRKEEADTVDKKTKESIEEQVVEVQTTTEDGLVDAPVFVGANRFVPGKDLNDGFRTIRVTKAERFLLQFKAFHNKWKQGPVMCGTIMEHYPDVIRFIR
eukprot:g5856.t1